MVREAPPVVCKNCALLLISRCYIGPRFKTLRDSMLTREDFDEAKRRARERMELKRD